MVIHGVTAQTATSIRWEAYILKWQILSFLDNRFLLNIFHALRLKSCPLFAECSWLSNWWQGQATAAVIKHLYTNSIVYFFLFLFLPLSQSPTQLPSALFHLKPALCHQFSHFSCQSQKFMCSCQKQPLKPWHKKADSPSHMITAGKEGFK